MQLVDGRALRPRTFSVDVLLALLARVSAEARAQGATCDVDSLDALELVPVVPVAHEEGDQNSEDDEEDDEEYDDAISSTAVSVPASPLFNITIAASAAPPAACSCGCLPQRHVRGVAHVALRRVKSPLWADALHAARYIGAWPPPPPASPP